MPLQISPRNYPAIDINFALNETATQAYTKVKAAKSNNTIFIHVMLGRYSLVQPQIVAKALHFFMIMRDFGF